LKGIGKITTYSKKYIMSLLKNLFKSSSEEKKVVTSNVNWIPLKSLDQLEEINQISKEEAVVLFKHSTRCGISRMVLKSFEKQFDDTMSNLKVYYLDLLNYRELSSEVGFKYQILHQSPQLLVIKNGISVEHASHYDITTIDLKAYLV
jgi:bacillithiol system protein YtxJ